MKTSTLKIGISLSAMLVMAGSQNILAQLVTNATTLETFSTIQAAIDDPETLNGHTLHVVAGVYVENILVNKELTIYGPKMGMDGNDPLRGSGEAIIYPASVHYGDGTYNGGYLIRVTANNVTIDGLTLNGNNPSLEGVYSTKTGAFDIDFGIMCYWSGWYDLSDLSGNNITIQNNILRNFKLSAIVLGSTGSPLNNGVSKYGNVLHNKIQNAAEWPSISLSMNYYANIQYNTILDARTGIQAYWYWLEKSVNTTGTIENNSINLQLVETNWGLTYSDAKGISIILVYNGISDSWSISNNTITNTTTRSIGSRGVQFNLCWTPTALTVSNNDITGFESGYDIRNSGDGGENTTVPPTQSLTITGGTVENCKYGMFATNLSEYYGTAQSAMYNANQVTFLNNTEAGIYVDDESANPINTNPSTVATHASNCIITGSPIGLKVSGAYAFASAHNNNLSGNTSFAISNLSPNNVDATCNWYGSWTGPTNATNIGGLGTAVSSLVSFEPWITNGTDNDLVSQGFQPFPESCVPIKCGMISDKYMVCHKGKVICVDYVGAMDHLSHGDLLGECSASITRVGEMAQKETISNIDSKVTFSPNPFSSSTRVKYGLPLASKVSLKVYDAMGKEVSTIVNGIKEAGVYSVDFNTSHLTKGIYYYRMISISGKQEFIQSGKLIKL